MQTQLPDHSFIIQSGIDKLDNYIEKVNAVPAYILAMSKQSINYHIYLFIFSFYI